MKKNLGFTMVEVVVAICVVGIIGAVGYVWWQGQQPAPATKLVAPTQASNSVSIVSTPIPLNQTANWLTFTDNRTPITLKYPPDWSILVDEVPAGMGEGVNVEIADSTKNMRIGFYRYLGTGCESLTDPSQIKSTVFDIGGQMVTDKSDCNGTWKWMDGQDSSGNDVILLQEFMGTTAEGDGRAVLATVRGLKMKNQ